jgi:rSAM/selenodomain-associated transferase 1
MRSTLVLFLRQPRLGRGKRRLARDIGDLAALRFERLMLALLLRRLGRDRRWRLRVAITPDRARCDLGRRSRRIFITGQGTGDLGARMRRAINRCLSGPVVLIGADIPALRADQIAAAFRLLGGNDMVFGPAGDGGFWLVGARRAMPSFGKVRWSSRYALTDVLANLPRRLRIGFGATLDDVDDGAARRRLAPRHGF